jgi:hypothetical protein
MAVKIFTGLTNGKCSINNKKEHRLPVGLIDALFVLNYFVITKS